MAGERERYSIIKRLDKGGMAEVFLARSTSLEGFDKVVAIKRVLPHLAANERFVNMFLDEAKLSLHLDHANIVSVFDVGRSGQTYFIVMEFIDGTNMKRLVDRRAMPLDLAVYVAIEVCKGLVYAHEKLDTKGQPLQIVHRDISPPNILISREGEVKLTDFGLARAVSQIESTDPGVVKGKFAYLSPEASLGEEVDLRADIFAAGIVLWESLTGRRLFQGQTDLETLENVRACKVPSIHRVRTDIPAALDRILSRALAKKPADRYSSAREMGRELSQFLVEQRMSVTSYDLASWIQEIIDLPPEASRLSPTLAESAVQAELERFVGLEEDSVVVPTSARGARTVPKSDFEDPRLWGLMDDASGRDIEASLANTPSGVFNIRAGTQKLGRPLTDAETGAETDAPPVPKSSGRRSLPPTTRPRVPTTKTSTLPRGNVPTSKGSGASRLPPPSLPPRSKPPSMPPRSAASRTMMMSPVDEAFFDALDENAETSSPAEPRGEGRTAPPSLAPPSLPPPPLAPPMPGAEASPPADPPAEAARAPEPDAPLAAAPSVPDGVAAVQVDDHDASALALDHGAPSREAEEAPADEPITAPVIAPAATEDDTTGPQRTAQLAAGRAAQRQRPPEAPAEVDQVMMGGDVDAHPSDPRPWAAQLITVAAFGAVVYFSYQILTSVI